METKAQASTTETQLRFPRDFWEAESWTPSQDQSPAPLAVTGNAPDGAFLKVCGADDHVVHTLTKVAALIRERPEDFANACRAIQPEGWRLLYVCGDAFALESLVLPRFSATHALRDLCDLQKHDGSPPAHLLGTERSGEGIAHETAVALRELSSNESAAAWAILCAAHVLNFSEAELVSYEWWTPTWLTLVTQHLCADNAL